MSIDRDAPAMEEPKTAGDAIKRLPVGAVIANKYQNWRALSTKITCPSRYRVVSSFTSCKGYMREALEMSTRRPVSLRFYEDQELMQKHAGILESFKEFSWACK